MNKQIAVKTREKWVDDIKVIACILVVLQWAKIYRETNQLNIESREL